MKTTVLSLAMVLFLAAPVLGQNYDDELYYVPSAKKARSSKTVESTPVNSQEQRQVVTSSSQSGSSYQASNYQQEIDVDAYNRRYDASSSNSPSQDYYYSDTTDLAHISDEYVYDEGMEDENDYQYTTAIVRFRNPSLVVYLDSPYYWGSSFGWGWGGYYNSWYYDPWYYPGWSFSWSWGWGGSYYYRPYYAPYYGPHYGWGGHYHRPHYGWAPRNVSHRPDRSGYGFGRNTRGTYGRGDSRPANVRGGSFGSREGTRTDVRQRPSATTGRPGRPGGTTRETTTGRPGGTTRETTTGRPGGTTRETTTGRPGGTTRETTTGRPGGTTRETTTGRPGGTTRETTTGRPGGTTRETTTSRPSGTTRETTTSRPSTTTNRPGNSSERGTSTPSRVTSTPSRSSTPSVSSPSSGGSSRGSFGGGSSGRSSGGGSRSSGGGSTRR